MPGLSPKSIFGFYFDFVADASTFGVFPMNWRINMHVRQIIAGIAILCSLVSAEATATQIMTIPVSENAYVYKAASTTDQNDYESLIIKTSGTDSNTRLIYLRYDLSALPSNLGQITSAQLRLYHTKTQNGTLTNTVSLYGLPDGSSELGWTNALTYSTRPDGTANIPNTNTTTALSSLGISDADNGSIITLGSTTDWVSFLSADTNGQATFILGGEAGLSISSFASRTNTSGYPIPELTVEYTLLPPVPEPSTALLAFCGVVGLRKLRRRGSNRRAQAS
jgi:hypothetical protein